MNTDDESRQSKKRSAGRQGIAGPGSEKAINAKESGASTRGHRKVLQKLEDLCQNEKYGPELAAILRTPEPKERSQKLAYLAATYGIDCYQTLPWTQLIVDKNAALHESALDFCQVIDEANEMLIGSGSTSFVMKPSLTSDKLLSVLLYPVHICISRSAKQRDVVDYVQKRWGEIQQLLEHYGEKQPVIRKRSKPARDTFIWEHRDVPSEELADLVDREFPGESLTYADINSIKRKLRKRYLDK